MLIMMGKMLWNRCKKMSAGFFIALTFLWPVFSLGNSKQKYELSSLKCVFCLDWCVWEPHIFWTAWRIHLTSRNDHKITEDPNRLAVIIFFWNHRCTCFLPSWFVVFVLGSLTLRWLKDAGNEDPSRVDRPHAGFRNMASTRGAGVTCWAVEGIPWGPSCWNWGFF